MTIIIADDHPIVLQGILTFLVSRKFKVLCTCSNGIETWNSLQLLNPDVLLLDHNMPGMTGMEIAERVREAKMKTKVVLLTMYKEKSLLDKAIAIGVNGYLLKDFALQELEQCMHTLEKGGNYYSKELTKHIVLGEAEDGQSEINKLTATEQKILKIIAGQKSSQEIADMLFISLKTVEKHRSNIIKKLGLPHTPTSIAIWAAKNKI